MVDESRIKEIIENHKHFINGDCSGWRSMRANFSGEDLSGADLNNLNLLGADLRHANLSHATLYGTNLRNANLMNANLHNADLRYANLSNVNLCNANLVNANLNNADLSSADLSNSNLSCANLSHVNLNTIKGPSIEYRKGKILTEDIIGYKKCKNVIIVTLKIPRGAIVFSINGIKCRTNKAKVIAIDGADRAYSVYNNMSYYIGDEFTIYDFNCEYNIECAEGIHFFMTREEAMTY